MSTPDCDIIIPSEQKDFIKMADAITVGGVEYTKTGFDKEALIYSGEGKTASKGGTRYKRAEWGVGTYTLPFYKEVTCLKCDATFGTKQANKRVCYLCGLSNKGIEGNITEGESVVSGHVK